MNSLVTRYALVLITILPLLNSCNGRFANIGGERVARVNEPFSQRKYRSNKKFFRAVGSAESSNMNFSKENALFNAKKELASNVSTLFKGVTQRYSGERAIENKMEFNQSFEDLTREVLNTRLAGVRVIGEQVFKKENNRWLAYTAVEIDMESFYYALTERIGSRKEIKQFWDEKRFRDVYNEEMDRIERSN
jgi:hypothetical protein